MAERDAELEDPAGLQGPLLEYLRPVTPTGSLVDSDPEKLVTSKATPPTVQELDRPHTPGKGIVVELECEDSSDEISSEPTMVSSTECETSYQDRPRTPGRENTGCCFLCGSVRGPDREVAECSTVTQLPASSYVRAPKTPGRDINLSHRDIVFSRKTEMSTASPTVRGDSHRASSPCGFSDSSSSDGRETWVSTGVRAKCPLQGLENMPGLLYEGSRREEEESFSKRKQKRKLKMERWRLKINQRQRSFKRVGASLSCQRRRSPIEERRILHKVWKDGLDEEDARLLHCAYDRLQAQECVSGWVSHTLWTAHPHILFMA